MTIMKLSTLIPALQIILATHGDADVLVCVQSQGELRGHTPAVAVTDAHAGFDWDSGRVLLSTENPLVALSADEVSAILKSVRAGHPGSLFGGLKWSLRSGPHRRVLIDVLHSARILVGGQVSE